MRWNIEISVNFEGGPYINAHAQIISWQRQAEVKNSCFLVAVSLLKKTA